MSAGPRIAVLTHSTNPRGGVVHAMQLAEALHRQDHDVTLVAPALPGCDFPRRPRCPARLVPARPVGGTVAMVRTRIAEVAAFLDGAGFELFHAQDSITANALADLAGRGRIAGYVRTVHHLDRFDDLQLEGWQDRGVRAAAALCCVSRHWQDRLHARYGRRPTLVGNGVDTAAVLPACRTPTTTICAAGSASPAAPPARCSWPLAASRRARTRCRCCAPSCRCRPTVPTRG